MAVWNAYHSGGFVVFILGSPIKVRYHIDLPIFSFHNLDILIAELAPSPMLVILVNTLVLLGCKVSNYQSWVVGYHWYSLQVY